MSEDVAWSDAILVHPIKLYLIVAVFRVLGTNIYSKITIPTWFSAY